MALRAAIEVENYVQPPLKRQRKGRCESLEKILEKTGTGGVFLARAHVKTVRSKGRVYFYLVEPQIVNGKTVGAKVLRRLTEEEARSYGTRREPRNQTVESEGHEARPAGVEPGTAPLKGSASITTTPEAALRASIEPSDLSKQEAAGQHEKVAFIVGPRPRGFYALEPRTSDLARGYVMVRTDSDGVTNVFCGLCAGFTCVHVEFMKEWSRTHQ